ncbi:MAG: hypothetical protein QE570_11250 [Verrucomicrobiota bacterium]|nr:hypothetical protein [Verrucomicrobiota bacterium]
MSYIPTPAGCQRSAGGGFKWVPPSAVHLAKRLPLTSSRRSLLTQRSFQGRAAAGHRSRHAGRVCSNLPESRPVVLVER